MILEYKKFLESISSSNEYIETTIRGIKFFYKSNYLSSVNVNKYDVRSGKNLNDKDFITKMNYTYSDLFILRLRYITNNYKIPFHSLEDGSIDFDGTLDYSEFKEGDEYINRLPFNFNIINGDCFIQRNNISTLEDIGCPNQVDGDFNCSINKLENLKGGPSIVKGRYMCFNNRLTSLEGVPDILNGIDCSKNLLENLNFLPKEINGDFCCSNNNLISLDTGPKYVKGDYICIDNKLSKIEDYPTCIIDGAFKISNQNLQPMSGFSTLNGVPKILLQNNFDIITNLIKRYKEDFIPLLDNKVKFHQKIILYDKLYNYRWEGLNKIKGGELEKFYTTIRLNNSTRLLL